MKTHYSAAELAAMKLSGLPTSVRGMIDRARKDSWTSRQVPGKGGKGGMRTEYQPPEGVLDKILFYIVTQQIEREHENAYPTDNTGKCKEISGAEDALRSGVVASGAVRGKLEAAEVPDGRQRFDHALIQGGKGDDTSKNCGLSGDTKKVRYPAPEPAEKDGVDQDRARAIVDDASGDQRVTAVAKLQPGSVRETSVKNTFQNQSSEPSSSLGANNKLVSAGRNNQDSAGALVRSEAHHPAVNLADLSREDRECNEARARIVRYVKHHPGSATAAIAELNTLRNLGKMPKGMEWAFDHAWDKPRGNALCRDTLNKWISLKNKTGSYAPLKPKKDCSVKPWHPLAVELRRRPQGSHLTWLHEQLCSNWQDAWGEPVSYDVVRRFFKEKFSQLDQLKGRWTGSQLRSKKFYQHRSREGLVPAQEVHGDGWNTHFTAPHPVTGEFVTYEVWHFHDVATRYTPAPGIGLTEKYEVIAKGVENFIRELGMPMIVQVDSTKVVKDSDRFTKHPILSLEERIGFTIVHPKEVGNSQANGICENFNISYLDKRAKELATYQNPKSMDELSFKRVKKITTEMVKAANKGDLALRDQLKRDAVRMGKGMVFDSCQEAIEWILRIVNEFNDKPHRELPKVRCPQTGRMRHQTPREALAEFRAKGWEPMLMGDTPEAHELALVDAFRPRAIVKVTRETVSPYGGMRFKNKEVLGHWNDKHVVVIYDIHEWRSVRIADLNGEYICMAEFVEATGYRTVTAYEDAEAKRAKSRIRLREKQIDQIKARTPGAAIEAPKPSADHAQLMAEARNLYAEGVVIDMPVPRQVQQDAAAATPLEGMNNEQKYDLWLELDGIVRSGADLTDAWQQRFHAGFQKTSAYRSIRAMRQEESPTELQL
jgi:putative transposase